MDATGNVSKRSPKIEKCSFKYLAVGDALIIACNG